MSSMAGERSSVFVFYDISVFNFTYILKITLTKFQIDFLLYLIILLHVS